MIPSESSLQKKTESQEPDPGRENHAQRPPSQHSSQILWNFRYLCVVAPTSYNKHAQKLGVKKPVGLDTFTARLDLKQFDRGNDFEPRVINFPYTDLVATLQAFEIPCFDLFLDYCRTTSLDTIAVIKANDKAPTPLYPSTENDQVAAKPVGSIELIFPQALGTNRTKIEVVALDANKETEFNRHSGHEYVVVLSGQVEASFRNSKGEESKHELKKGDGIAFSSRIQHKFRAVSAKAILHAARPTISGGAPEKSN